MILESLPPRMVKKIAVIPCAVADIEGDCWDWVGAIQGKGYGSFSYEGRIWSTHRLAYELLVGLIPDGLTIDHLCHNKTCCNPGHLEPVTIAENIRRRNAYNSSRYGSCFPGFDRLCELVKSTPHEYVNGRVVFPAGAVSAEDVRLVRHHIRTAAS